MSWMLVSKLPVMQALRDAVRKPDRFLTRGSAVRGRRAGVRGAGVRRARAFVRRLARPNSEAVC